MKGPSIPFNKWIAIGLLCLFLAVLRLRTGGWVLALILVALGALNLFIGLRQPSSLLRGSGPEAQTHTTWAQVLTGAGLLFVVSAGVVLLISGSLAAAFLMGALFTAPLFTIGAARARRGE